LAGDAGSEGFGFIDRLDREWADGSNRFDRDGECLLGLIEDNALIAIGGLNRDPYTFDIRTGRIRHLYVRPKFRRSGCATQLMRELLLRGETVFSGIRLRTTSSPAQCLYERLDFQPVNETDATHILLSRRSR
jgi:GNAT superfamily N-acetyltransferase